MKIKNYYIIFICFILLSIPPLQMLFYIIDNNYISYPYDIYIFFNAMLFIPSILTLLSTVLVIKRKNIGYSIGRAIGWIIIFYLIVNERFEGNTYIVILLIFFLLMFTFIFLNTNFKSKLSIIKIPALLILFITILIDMYSARYVIQNITTYWALIIPSVLLVFIKNDISNKDNK